MGKLEAAVCIKHAHINMSDSTGKYFNILFNISIKISNRILGIFLSQK